MIWILYGEEEFRRTQRRQSLIKDLLGEMLPDLTLTVFKGKAFTESAFQELYEPPFLAPHKVVVISDAETLSKSQLNLLIRYCQNPAPHTRLILDFAQPEKPPLPSEGEIFYEEFRPLRPNEVVEWVFEQAKSLQLRLMPEAAASLVEIVGRDLRLLRSYLEMLQIYRHPSPEAPLTIEEITEALGMDPQYPLYKLTDALAAGNFSEALRIGSAFAEDVRSYPLSQVIGHLRFFYQQLAYLHISQTPPALKAIQQRLQLRFAFQAKTYEQALRHIDLEACRRALSLLRLADARQKGVIPSRQTERQLLIGLIQNLVISKNLELK
ncbi:MAG: DNA polymerase III subunit delta [Bacteroidia bacterium]|nr:DNA polymerase III subunit delta [Bacteroidia bacterium]MDW8015821.1 DNA polymerase III subunit delta [Bacteroidia bacterium]